MIFTALPLSLIGISITTGLLDNTDTSDLQAPKKIIEKRVNCKTTPKWPNDFEAAKTLALSQKKKLLVYVYDGT